MYTKLYASRSYVYAVARACDRGKVSRKVSFVQGPGDYLLVYMLMSFTKSVELCRSNTVFDAERCGSCNGRDAVFGRQWIYKWSVISDLKSGFVRFQYFKLDYPMGRIVRDSRLYTVGAGTQEIRRMLIGREFNEQLKDSA
jgi:isovaleryl-CoA dehydrogenase